MTLITLLALASGIRADITIPREAPPQADAYAARVWRGGQTVIPLRAHYGGGGTVTFWIVQRPEHGKLSDLRLLGDNRATINYENDGAEAVASDGFRYVAKVDGARTSSPAEVRITVEEAPARMVVPGRLEFGEIMAGENGTRPLPITNEGGGVLEGRLSASAPWWLAVTEYRVKSGETEVIEVGFWPDEAREFVGLISLTGADGIRTSVQLAGRASAPVRVEPEHLQIEAPKSENNPRSGSVSLTNQTEHVVQLKMEAGPSIQPIPEISLAPHETKRFSIIVLLHRQLPLQEEITFVGAGFKARLPVDASAAPVAPRVVSKRALLPALSPAVPASPTPMARIVQSEAIATIPPAASSSPAQSRRTAFLPIRVRRTGAADWELDWARSKIPVAKYRVEERFVSLDGAGELQTLWRAIRFPEIVESGDEVIARIKGLEPKQLHILRVTALGPGGEISWESLPVTLAPPREERRNGRGWLLVLGPAFLVLLFLRWRAKRATDSGRRQWR